jgi:hypothetical protein
MLPIAESGVALSDRQCKWQCRLIWCIPPGRISEFSSADFDDGATPANGQAGVQSDAVFNTVVSCLTTCPCC